jgi:hypothetical protein
MRLTCAFPVVGTGVDPVTSRFSEWRAVHPFREKGVIFSVFQPLSVSFLPPQKDLRAPTLEQRSTLRRTISRWSRDRVERFSRASPSTTENLP